MKKTLLLLLFCFAINMPLYSLVESITIRWVPMRCADTCVRLLEREFRKVQGIDQIFIDQGSGQATLTWKEKIPFQFVSVSTAMRLVGLSMREIRIRVSGTISHRGDSFYIISEGDNTPFELLNPIIPVPQGVTPEFNANARKLTPALRQRLLEGQMSKQTATVEGPVFMPERKTVPTQLILDSLDFQDSDAQDRAQ